MCRKLALAATALMLPLVLAATPALAWGLGKPAAATAAATNAASTPAAPAPAAGSKASAQDRAAADRMDPLGRAAFWASQV
ncbi:MAG: hypothetical protein JWO72_1361, partial [Caulobacteraceae bacterium]|nr:hypothetical protein [Caulobacteraceae bacterium]